MSRLKHLSWVLTAGILTAGIAHGQAVESNGQATSQTGATANTRAAQASTEATTTTDANAQVDVQKLRESIEKRALKTTAAARARAEGQLEATAKQVDATAQKSGDPTVAERLAGEFGVSAQAITDEHTQLGVSWGQLMIAHTLSANSKTGVTAQQLLEMKHDGMGWGKIASGLGFTLGSAVSSVKAEGQVANGLAKADGHVMGMRGEGVKAGMSANAGLHTDVNANHAAAGAGAGAGLGVKIGK